MALCQQASTELLASVDTTAYSDYNLAEACDAGFMSVYEVAQRLDNRRRQIFTREFLRALEDRFCLASLFSIASFDVIRINIIYVYKVCQVSNFDHNDICEPHIQIPTPASQNRQLPHPVPNVTMRPLVDNIYF